MRKLISFHTHDDEQIDYVLRFFLGSSFVDMRYNIDGIHERKVSRKINFPNEIEMIGVESDTRGEHFTFRYKFNAGENEIFLKLIHLSHKFIPSKVMKVGERGRKKESSM